MSHEHDPNSDKLALFKKIMSSPLDDLVSCGGVVHHMVDTANVLNLESTRQYKMIEQHESFEWDALKEEQQLYVQVNIKNSEYFDDSINDSVSKSDMDVNVLINRTRFIVNMPTVANLINVYNELIRSFYRMQFTYNERVLEYKEGIIRALKQRDNSYSK